MRFAPFPLPRPILWHQRKVSGSREAAMRWMVGSSLERVESPGKVDRVTRLEQWSREGGTAVMRPLKSSSFPLETQFSLNGLLVTSQLQEDVLYQIVVAVRIHHQRPVGQTRESHLVRLFESPCLVFTEYAVGASKALRWNGSEFSEFSDTRRRVCLRSLR